MTHMKVMLRFPLSIRINIFTGKDCCMQGLLYLIPILRCYFIGKQREEIREIRDIPGSCLSKSFMPSARKAMFQLTHFILWLLPLHKILIRDCCKGATTRMSIVYVVELSGGGVEKTQRHSWAPAGISPEGGKTARTDENDLFFGAPKAQTNIYTIFSAF